MSVKVFNLMSGLNETIFSVPYKLCDCKCGLNESVHNSKKITMNVGMSVKN